MPVPMVYYLQSDVSFQTEQCKRLPSAPRRADEKSKTQSTLVVHVGDRRMDVSRPGGRTVGNLISDSGVSVNARQSK